MIAIMKGEFRAVKGLQDISEETLWRLGKQKQHQGLS
jgi:hypothetical protein